MDPQISSQVPGHLSKYKDIHTHILSGRYSTNFDIANVRLGRPLDENVGWLEVAMEDEVGVEVLQALEDLADDPSRARLRHDHALVAILCQDLLSDWYENTQ